MNGLSLVPGPVPAQQLPDENGSYREDVVRQMSDSAVLEQLTPRIRQDAAAWFPDLGIDVRVRGRVWGGQETARTFRYLIQARDGSRGHAVFVKLCPVFDRINPSRMEYETLLLLHERMPALQSRCRVSRPLGFYPELNAYAMESVGTENFKPRLLRLNSRFRSTSALAGLLALVDGCAVWLRTFHDLTRAAAPAVFDSRSFIASMEEESGGRTLADYRFPRETLQELDRCLGRLPLLDHRHRLPAAKWHWDYTPGHVYLDNGCVSVIDILGVDDTPVFEDIGRFLAAMAMANSFPFHPFYDHHRADTLLADRFLAAYASEGGCDPHAFTLFAELYKLKYLVSWFHGQQFRISDRIHPRAGRLYADLRLVRMFTGPLTRSLAAVAAAFEER